MTNIKLIATDIDGTLFDSEHNYNVNRLNDYLKQLHQRNIKFAIASGNNLDHLKKIFVESPDIDIFIAENGSQVVSHDRTIAEKTIAKDLVTKMISTLNNELDLKALSLSGKKASYSESLEHQPLYHIGNLKVVDDLTNVEDDIFKFNIQLDHDKLTPAEDFINDNYGKYVHAATSGFGSIDIMSANINKAVGLKFLADHTDITLDNIMTFGDNTNDLEMIQDSGVGVAMLNGKKQVKAAANLITKTDNDHDGVLNTIQEYFQF